MKKLILLAITALSLHAYSELCNAQSGTANYWNAQFLSIVQKCQTLGCDNSDKPTYIFYGEQAYTSTQAMLNICREEFSKEDINDTESILNNIARLVKSAKNAK